MTVSISISLCSLTSMEKLSVPTSSWWRWSLPDEVRGDPHSARAPLPPNPAAHCVLRKLDSGAARTTCHQMDGVAGTRHARVWDRGASPVWELGKEKIWPANTRIKHPLIRGCWTRRPAQQLFLGPDLVEALTSPFCISFRRSILCTEPWTFNIQTSTPTKESSKH